MTSTRARPFQLVNANCEFIFIFDYILRKQPPAYLPGKKRLHLIEQVFLQCFNDDFMKNTLFHRDALPISKSTLKVLYSAFLAAVKVPLPKPYWDRVFAVLCSTLKCKFANITSINELYFFTESHLKHFETLIQDWKTKRVTDTLVNIRKKLIAYYEHISIGEFFRIRNTILSVFYNSVAPVDVLIKNGLQDEFGIIQLLGRDRFPTPTGSVFSFDEKDGTTVLDRYILPMPEQKEQRTKYIYDLAANLFAEKEEDAQVQVVNDESDKRMIEIKQIEAWLGEVPLKFITEETYVNDDDMEGLLTRNDSISQDGMSPSTSNSQSGMNRNTSNNQGRWIRGTSKSQKGIIRSGSNNQGGFLRCASNCSEILFLPPEAQKTSSSGATSSPSPPFQEDKNTNGLLKVLHQDNLPSLNPGSQELVQDKSSNDNATESCAPALKSILSKFEESVQESNTQGINPASVESGNKKVELASNNEQSMEENEEQQLTFIAPVMQASFQPMKSHNDMVDDLLAKKREKMRNRRLG